MDLSCIISSGDLELYVLGMLPEDETCKISQLANLFEEVCAEINRIQETLHIVAEKGEEVPGPHVRENFLKAIKCLKAENPVIEALPPQLHLATDEIAKVVSLGDRKGNAGQFLLAASVIALVVSLAGIVYFYKSSDRYEQQLATTQAEMKTIRNSSEVQSQQLKDYVSTIAMIKDPNTRKIDLANTPGKPAAVVAVFWNKTSGDVMLADVSLPAIPQGKQYQLWAMVKGKPVDAGMLSNDKATVQKMKTFNDADAFAITMENEGGSPTPTLTALMVIGKVS